MATALEGVSNLTILDQVIEPDRAQTLRARHDIAIDGVGVLTKGTKVTYTDTDLGKVFEGKIVKVEKIYEDGEGVLYRCAGPFRTIAKTVAKVALGGAGEPSSKIRFEKGTDIGAAIDAVLSQLPATLYPLGVDKSNLPAGVTPLMDKGGQNVDIWLDDLLDQTSGGIVYSVLTGAQPKLVFEDFYTQPSVTLLVGTYNVVNTSPGDLLLEGGRFGGSIDQKYETVGVEGGGIFTRVIEQFIPAKLSFQDYDHAVFQYRWYVPDNARVTCRYITPDLTCDTLCRMRLRIGGDSDSAYQRDLDNPAMGIDDDGNRFWFVNIVMKGAAITSWRPPQVEAWFTYTRYDGPLVSKKSSTDPALEDEGDYWEQYPEYFKYTSPAPDNVSIDFSPDLDTIRDALYDKYSGDADTQGNLRIHINDINTNLKLGSDITNFSGSRVRSIRYDFVRRSITVDLSNKPIRDDLRRIKQQIKDGTLEGNNWYATRSRTKSDLAGCFDDIETFLDHSGDPTERPGVPEDIEGGEATYDCQFGECVPISGAGGQYVNRRECERVCGTGLRYHCVDCGGCVQTEDANALYDSLSGCEAVCKKSDDPSCQFNCDPVQGCVAAENGVFASIGACQAVCFEEGSGPGGSGGIGGSGSGSGLTSGVPASGSGSGDSDVNVHCNNCADLNSGADNWVVNEVCVDDFGHVQRINCVNIGAGGGGGNGCANGVSITSMKILCCVQCSNGNLTVLERELTFVSGCLTNVQDCSSSEFPGGDCP